ncbi:pathogenesis-related thaumatin-like protein 3.5 [Impatiens glandulifera]|uniref:pathogenesis-related thaumatin-like protein 3.5 n=1 Tax=Impatiens glandulifera TaxID=253017 RepID=UPI001FB12452|nr:pathogenesis-related thaumatin-like protein 3.5 [Impatiens glandulifera]
MKVINNNQRLFIFIYLSSLISLSLIPSSSCAFIVTNNCPYTIWPATLAGAGTPPLPTTGFRLDSGQTLKIPSTPGWSGRIWARTGCAFDETTGVGLCQTGDCGRRLECDGMGASPPASLFEITLGVGDQKDFYDVSIVDGYNLPLIAAPIGVFGGGCNATGCVSDINMGCPRELQVVDGEENGGGGGVVGCKSACEAFGLDQYCCSGEFANPNTCRPSIYSSIFKMACPRAYSYAFDDGTSTFTCKAYDYAIIFCPTYSSAAGNSSSSGNGTRWSGGGGGGESTEPVIQDISRSKLEGKVSKTVSSSTLAIPKLLINFIVFFISFNLSP